jgi:signal transduction histidine kinase
VQLQQVLLNLITNGLDAMVERGPDARELWISTAQEGTDWVEAAVKDCGIGIPEGDLDRLFRHFFTTKPDGMGMGLPICRSIVEAHGGRLSVKNNRDRGVTVRFTLPVYAEPSS